MKKNNTNKKNFFNYISFQLNRFCNFLYRIFFDKAIFIFNIFKFGATFRFGQKLKQKFGFV